MAQLTLFFVTLIFFLATQMDFRRYVVSFFATRDAKLRFIRIANDIEDNLASYVAIMTIINFGLGVMVAARGMAVRFSEPDHLRDLGHGAQLHAVYRRRLHDGDPARGRPRHLSIAGVCARAAGAFVALATVEGQFITPAVLGHRLTLNPLVVLLALAFWAWLWGPMGAFLAVPFTIVGMVTLHHLFPPDEDKLPGLMRCDGRPGELFCLRPVSGTANSQGLVKRFWRAVWIDLPRAP